VTWLAIVLLGAGVADLVRSSVGRRGRVAAHVAAPVTVALAAVLTDVDGWADVLALAVGAAGLAAWTELSRRAQRTGLQAVGALASLLATLAVLVAFSGAASTAAGPLQRWLYWADLPGAPASAGRVLLVAALVLFNVATANVIVRLVLLAIGALRPDQVAAPHGQAPQSGSRSGPQAADRLKGGRLLGPMERLVILGLGLAGEFGAAGLVIAAKGLLRFPELQASGRASLSGPTGGARGGPVGIDDVTEYFLVGSFVSWLLALLTLALSVAS
jgi:hypothetical protein